VLQPYTRRFFTPLTDASRNLVAMAALCVEIFDRHPEVGDRLDRLEAALREGDGITGELYGMLNETFVTPVDRDDLHDLGRALDDICDLIEECGSLPDTLGLETAPERARAQARVLVHACERLLDGVERLPRMPDLHAEIEDVYQLEDEGDRLHRDAVARLFADGSEPLSVIRLKTVHDRLEAAIDATKTAARVLEAMTLKAR
jgi:uncharacterized protein Yka (UPF0111/DUF47 family)